MKSTVTILALYLFQTLYTLKSAPEQREVLPGLALSVNAFERIALPVYKDQAVYLRCGSCVALLKVDPRPGSRAQYKIRYIDDKSGRTVEKVGELEEKYERIEREGGGWELIDAGSKVTISAGSFEVYWSHGSKELSYIYYDPTKIIAAVINAEWYENGKILPSNNSEQPLSKDSKQEVAEP